MLDRTIVLGTIAACMLATPVAAQGPAPAPTTTAFDGSYVGVSRSLEGNMLGPNTATRGCTPSGQPGPLTIAGGVARYQAGVGTYVSGDGTYEGSVNAQGVLILRGGPSGNRIDAQIDGRGSVTGRLTSRCSYQMVWQKEGK
jgi:hypothetical protein